MVGSVGDDDAGKQYLNRLGEFYKLDLVDGIFHAFIKSVTVCRA